MSIEITAETPVSPELTDRFIAYRSSGATPNDKTIVVTYQSLLIDILEGVLPVTASRTLAPTDNLKVLESDNGPSEVVLTIPVDSPVQIFSPIQVAAGTFTIAPGAGTTLNGGTDEISLAAQFVGATVYQRPSVPNAWIMTVSAP